MPDFASLFGVEIIQSPAETTSLSLLSRLFEVVGNSVDSQIDAYEGFWRTTHASVFEPGRFCQQHGMIRRDAGGILRFELGADNIPYGGSMFPVEGQVFAIASDSVRHVPSFLILNVVPMPRILLLDGLLIAASNSLRVPTAYSIIFERIGDLSGDGISDDAHVADLMMRPEFPEDQEAVSETVRNHLLRDFGPAAAQNGGDMMLSATLTPRLGQIVALLNRQK